MTVSSTLARQVYAGDGATIAFPIPFTILDPAHLSVMRRLVTGVEESWVLNTQYTISASPFSTLTTKVGFTLATGEKLVMLRNVPLTQGTDYRENDPFPAETHERALDQLTHIAQQFGEKIDRSITLPASFTGGQIALPEPVANNVLIWNAAGTALVNGLTGAAINFGPGDTVINDGGQLEVAMPIKFVASPYTLIPGDRGLLVAVNTTGTVTLPTNGSLGANFYCAIKNNGVGATVTVAPVSGGSIDGFSNITLIDSESFFVQSNGTVNWRTIGRPPADSIANARLANMPPSTIKGNDAGATDDPLDLTDAQVAAMLPAVIGDAGAGGTKGLVPAPAAGDAAAGKFLKADGTWAAPTGTAAGKVVQAVNTQTGAVATGTTIIPFDDTIPQSTEGNQYMTLAITPNNAANRLRIDVLFQCDFTTSVIAILALFKDSDTGALAVSEMTNSAAFSSLSITLTHFMVAGTTSPITFKVRAGPSVASTLTFNGSSGARKFGGVLASSITITEIAP